MGAQWAAVGRCPQGEGQLVDVRRSRPDHRGTRMTPELSAQLAEQEAAFAALIVQPEGVTIERDELAGVPVEWTVSADGPTDPDLVVLYLHGGGYSSASPSGLVAARPASPSAR